MTSRAARRPLPSRHYLAECFTYCAGALLWKKRPRHHFATPRAMKSFNAARAGSRAGAPMRNGYRVVSIGGVKFLEHRVIFHMLVGLHDAMTVDHIDLDFSNNRITNLRCCSHAENLMNLPRRDRIAGRDHLPKHVYWSKREKKYKVGLRARGRRVHVGTFATLEQASAAAARARKELHGEFARSDL